MVKGGVVAQVAAATGGVSQSSDSVLTILRAMRDERDYRVRDEQVERPDVQENISTFSVLFKT